MREVNRHLESKVAEKTKEYLKVIEELRLSEQKFFQAFYLNPEMSSITSLQEGVFLDVNNVYTQTTGYSKAELIGKTSLELGLWGNPEDRETLKYLIQKDQRVRNLDVVLRIKSGKLLYILFSAELINLNGKDCLISIAINITNRKITEEETKKALEKEKELNELKSRFVSMVSHEFKTPLTSIKSSAQLLQKNFHKWTEEKIDKYIQNVIFSVDRINQLLENTLFLGKIEIEFKPKMANLKNLINKILQEIYFIFKEDNYKISMNITGSYQSVFLDPIILRHILINILSNAIKYSKSQTLNHIEINVNCSENSISLKIKDHGIGIPEKDQKLIFQPYHRSSNVGSIPGTGLGMVVIKKFVDIHKGSIEIMSKEQEGTTVQLTFPKLEQ
ncbi:MAG: PAS domain-containing sensor histidine kinase [Leptospiraceae bacterium]|nr:PAS domain S-box protein [Leptospiraceae bacterium]MCP5496871.1 PAS domain-containing sensor histidine kinase [Leptospiraceae bacterium]